MRQLDLEEHLARLFRRKWALVFNSGTSALRAALFGLELSVGSKIAVQAYNYPPVVLAVQAMGFMPILFDVDCKTMEASHQDLLSVIEKDVSAVIVTPMLGFCGNLFDIEPLCQRAGVPLLIDASRAYGAALEHRPVQLFGDLVVFSMNDSKVFGVGEGGFLLGSHPNLECRCAQLGLPLHPRGGVVSPGYELGYGEKLKIHPAGLRRATKMLPAVEKRIKYCQTSFETLENHSTDIVRGSGTRGAWKDVAFWKAPTSGRKSGHGRFRHEFGTNDISSWSPNAWKDGRQEFPGAQRVKDLTIWEDACPYQART